MSLKQFFSIPLRKKEIVLEMKVEESSLVNTDRKLCSQILQNLFGNAIKI